MMPGIRPPDQTEAQRLATKAEDAKRTAKDSAADGEIKPNDNILVFVNSKSGGMKGKKLLPRLANIFGDSMVVDLLGQEPYGAKEAIREKADIPGLRVVVCGGDGTVQWVFSDIEQLVDEGALVNRPGVAILPLGTGNDLSRQFGWGHGFRDSLIRNLRSSVEAATTTELDRWIIEMSHAEGTERTESSRDEYAVESSTTTKCGMSNYFGIGLDAKVVHNFESCRRVYPGLFCCRFSNNVIYGWFGITNFLRNSIRMRPTLRVIADGREVEVPAAAQGVSVINLRYFCAGIDMWKNVDEACTNDSKLEIFSFRGAIYLATVKAGFNHPRPITQCQELVLESLEAFSGQSLKVQVDGETQKIHAPFRIRISRSVHTALLLQGSRPAHGTCDVCC